MLEAFDEIDCLFDEVFSMLDSSWPCHTAAQLRKDRQVGSDVVSELCATAASTVEHIYNCPSLGQQRRALREGLANFSALIQRLQWLYDTWVLDFLNCHRKKRCQNCKKVVDFVRFHLGATIDLDTVKTQQQLPAGCLVTFRLWHSIKHITYNIA